MRGREWPWARASPRAGPSHWFPAALSPASRTHTAPHTPHSPDCPIRELTNTAFAARMPCWPCSSRGEGCGAPGPDKGVPCSCHRRTPRRLRRRPLEPRAALKPSGPPYMQAAPRHGEWCAAPSRAILGRLLAAAHVCKFSIRGGDNAYGFVSMSPSQATPYLWTKDLQAQAR